jgi:hypothetical protein
VANGNMPMKKCRCTLMFPSLSMLRLCSIPIGNLA